MTELYRAASFHGKAAPARPAWSTPDLGERVLWVQSLDPGETTGMCLWAIPRGCLLGDEPSRIAHREAFEITGSLQYQVSTVCWFARLLSARTTDDATLMVCEDFDLGGNRLQGCASEADVAIPIRWAAALQYAVQCGHADRSVLLFQPRTMAFGTATDNRLKAWDMWDRGSDHKRDATRHGIVAIRRISSGSIDAEEIWA